MFDGKHLVAMGTSINGLPVEIPMPADAKLWSPDSPFLYQMEVSLISAGKLVDQIKSYVAMRKYSMKRDEHGIVRLQLNNKRLVPVWSFRSGAGGRTDYIRLLQMKLYAMTLRKLRILVSI